MVWARYSGAVVVLLGAVFFVGKFYGLEGLCAGLVAVQMIYGLSFFGWPMRHFRLGWKEALAPVLTVWAGGGGGLLATYALKPSLEASQLPFVSVCSLVTIGASVFFLVIWLLDRRLLTSLVHLIVHRHQPAFAK